MILCIEALIWLALQKTLTHENLSSCIANTFHEKEASFMYLSFIHKIALSNFLSLRKKLFSIRGLARALLLKLHFMYLSFIHKIALSNFHWERSFSASVALHSLHLLSCTKHSISVLRSSKLVIQCIEALRWLALQKSSNTWKSVFCNANNINFMRKKHPSCTWALLLKLHLATFSHWERSFSASVAVQEHYS